MLTIGSKFQFDGESWKVEGFIGGDLKIRSTKGKPATFAVSELVVSPGFAFLDQDAGGEQQDETTTFPENASADAIRSAKILLEHLNEIETGFKSGFLGAALKHEPLPAYDVEETTSTQRLAAKALELGVTERTLWKQKAAYKASGIYGLLDQRQVRLSPSKTDARVIEALHFVVESLTDASNVTNQHIIRKIKKRLLAIDPNKELSIPSEATFNRLIARETKNKGLRGSAKGRRSINNGPETTYRRFYASRPGEMVILDSTRLDAFAMDPVSFKWISVELTIAIDLYTRSIVAWRFTPVSTKGVDAALLLHDILRPKMMLKGWPESARWSYVGVPEYIVIEACDTPPES